VPRTSIAAREAAYKQKCLKEGYEVLEIQYYYQNGRKKKKVKKRKVRDKS
jgi:hypothetical protein